MPEYQEILDSEVEPEAPLTSSLGVRFRDNPLAVWEGADGAPRIQTDALNNSAVTQDKLKMGTNSVSGTVSGGEQVTINLNDYSLFPSIQGGSGVLSLNSSEESASAANPRFNLRNATADSRSYAVAWRFVQA